MTLSRNLQVGSTIYRRAKLPLGNGGNGAVYKATYEGKEYALKVLPKNSSSKQRNRFFREMELLKDNCDLVGVPIYYGGVQQRSNLPSYYVMELGTNITSYLKDKPLNTVIECGLKLAETLSQLKERGISHRDIKPENILIINDAPALCDFGLAHKVGNPRLTVQGDKQIGAKMTMAPEMLRDPFNANYHKADIYSLAKTLWMLMTKDENSFDGCYNTHSKESLWNYDVEVLGNIEEMLTACTSNAPESRWTIHEFKQSCIGWLTTYEDPDRRKREGWRQLKARIFPYSKPSTATWKKRNDILTILNLVLSHNCRNHSFFPDGGGLDLESAEKSHEAECIELILSSFPVIIKPRSLSFYSPGEGKFEDQDYFLLEADNLDFVSDQQSKYDEELTELEPLKYTDPRCKEWNDYNGAPVPDGARKICRQKKGTFGIFMGASVYNRWGVVIDGKRREAYAHSPHNNVPPVKLFEAFQKMFSSAAAAPPAPAGVSPTYYPPETTRMRSKLLTHTQKQSVNSFLEELKNTDEYKKESQNATEGLTISSDTDYDELIDRIYAAENDKKKRTEVINMFNKNDLRLFNILYYAGRENSPPFGVTLENSPAHNFSEDELYETIYEKQVMALVMYIEKGLKMYG